MKTWETLKTTYKVSDFISWQRSQTLVLSPSFQRRPVWQPGAKSYLMDTILRALPIPILFLRDQKTDLARLTPVREVVDGQQRIRTIFSFIDPTLLKDYRKERDDFTIQKAHNKALAGKTFSDLDGSMKQDILDYTFSVHVLPSAVGDQEILEIFARMNSTGVKLNAQELRNARFYGEFKTSMYQLASEQLQHWRDWGIFTEYNIARMDEVEATSEFAILMLKGLTGKTQAGIDRVYNDKEESYPERTEVEQRFRSVMDTIADRLGEKIRFLPLRKQTMFYHLFLIIYHLSYGIKSPLASKNERKAVSANQIDLIKRAAEKIETQKAPSEVIQSVARRTTNLNSRTAVFDYFKQEVSVD
ncbi:DUF262 domain-containing protein [Chloroflexota bacterium]